MDRDQEVGKRIQELREQRGLLQNELAEQLRAVGINWSQGTLSRVELGSRPIRLVEAPEVATALRVTVADILPNSNLLGAELVKARLTEKIAEDDLDASRWKYEDVRDYRRALQFLEELASGSAGTYELNCSPANFLHHWLQADYVDLRTDPIEACRAVGLSDEEITKAQADADATAESWQKSQDPLSTIGALFSSDHTPPFEDSQAESAGRDLMSKHIRTSMLAENLGRLLREHFPNVIWQPAPPGTRNTSNKIDGLADGEP